MTSVHQKLSFWQKVRIAWQVVFHPRAPLSAKAVLAGALLYGILPIDLIPDIIPLFGYLDDVMVLIVAIGLFLRLTKAIRAEMQQEA